jgi:predicted AlkP superfamily phosphohydrolase/phosphomutase/tetratricopeptide (TPR) repeat protein
MKNKLLLIGWDAADWKIIGSLMAKNQMPALKKLIDNGVHGNMSTMNPPYSPMLWSSVATGKTPDKHGVLGFIELHPEKQAIRPVTVNSRKSKALWNIFHNQGMKSNLVGWWPSFPAEAINGNVVSDKFQKILDYEKRGEPLGKGMVNPESLEEEIKEFRFFPEELTAAHILPFIPNGAKIDFKEKKNARLLNAFGKIFSQNTSVHAAATKLMRTTEWDFMAVYYDMIDHFCHSFMKFHPPKLEPVPEELFENYKHVIESAYRYQDMMLERMIDLADENTTIIVMSDHGYQSASQRILKMPKYPAAPALEHRRFGIFVASGPGIKRKEKVYGMSLIDVAPTILHYYGLPIGKDMDGKPILDIFEKQTPPKYIDSWENVDGDFGMHSSVSGEDALSDQEAMEQMIELGYIDRPDEKIEKAIFKTKCDIRHNLARVFMGKKDFAESKKILLELIKEDIDTIPYYMDLMTIALEEKEFGKAEEYLIKLRELDKNFMLKTSLVEAKILISKNKLNEAIELLKEVGEKDAQKSGIYLELGNVYMKLKRFPDALEAYNKGLEAEQDNAKLHHAAANAYYQIGEYEEAADHAMTSIELVRYFPPAHYILGMALEKMGDLENAKLALEMAKRLKPQSHKTEKAIENISFQLGNQNGTESGKTIKEDIIIVSGLPRSGTSLMMQMLSAGGIEPLTDEKREADKSNPKGYYEYEPVKSLHRDNSWLGKAQNKSLKVVAPLLKHLDPKYRYKVVFMVRDLEEIVASQQTMLNKDPKTYPLRLFDAYRRQLDNVKIWEQNNPGVHLKYIAYKDLVFNPEKTIGEITNFLDKDLEIKEMANCVDKELYRNRA